MVVWFVEFDKYLTSVCGLGFWKVLDLYLFMIGGYWLLLVYVKVMLLQ